MKIRVNVNGVDYEVDMEGHERLIDLLRDKLGIKSVKEGCGSGECGVCTVLLDGRPVNSCLMLAVQARGKTITTVEGIGSADNPHPLQRAFLKVGAVQCGYCIPAVILTSKSLLDKNPNPSKEEIRSALRSVLCRCGSYLLFEEAIRAAVEERE